MKFSTKDFFSKCEQIRRKLRIWLHLQKKSLLENFIFPAVKILKLYYWEKNLPKSVRESQLHVFIKKFRIVQSKTVMEPVCSKVVVCEIPNFLQGCLLNPINKSQCSYHLETTQLICCVNQLNGFQIMETAPLDMLSSVLTYQSSCFRQFDWKQGTYLVTTHSHSKKFFDANLIDLFCKYYIYAVL